MKSRLFFIAIFIAMVVTIAILVSKMAEAHTQQAESMRVSTYEVKDSNVTCVTALADGKVSDKSISSIACESK